MTLKQACAIRAFERDFEDLDSDGQYEAMEWSDVKDANLDGLECPECENGNEDLELMEGIAYATIDGESVHYHGYIVRCMNCDEHTEVHCDCVIEEWKVS